MTLKVRIVALVLVFGYSTSAEEIAEVETTGSTTVKSPEDLRILLRAEQEKYALLAPPSIDPYWSTRDDDIFVNWSEWPESAKKLAVATLDENLIPRYEIYLWENPESGTITVANMYNETMTELQPEKGFDSLGWAMLHFGISVADELSSFQQVIHASHHTAVTLTLTPVAFEKVCTEFREEEQSLAMQEASAMPIGMVMMSLPSSPSNLMLAINGTTNTNTAVEIEIGYPETFTNKVEVYATTNLIKGEWEIVSPALVTTGSTSLVWTDTQTNLQFRAYQVGDADLDSDGDGLVDAREILIYHTDRFNSDSDGDYMDDAWELQYALNPNDDLDMILDPDHDMLPNVYEHYYGLNPNSADSSAITKLRVDPANAAQPDTYATIRDAFNASTNYSIIEVASGAYSGSGNTGLSFPRHPVMLMSDNWGTNRSSEIQSDGFSAFFMSDEQDNQTIVRGLNINLTGDRPMQSGFYLGEGNCTFTGVAPFFDGVKVELGDSDWAVGFYGLGSSDKTIRFNNCIVRGANNHHVSSGIYLVDSPKVLVSNCTFMDFNSSTNTSHGILLGTSPINLGHAAASIEARIENCFWDASFASNNNYAVAHALGSSGRYNTQVSSAIAPGAVDFLDVDSMSGLIETNGFVLRDGLILSNSPCINATVNALSWHDFHGQPRDSAPDMGADEYSLISTNDIDGDGLTDYAEAFTNFTSIFDYDSDDDGVGDGDEISCGTIPTNSDNYCVTILGSVDDQTGLGASVLASYALGYGNWNPAKATSVANGQFSYPHQIIDSPYPLMVQILIDLDGDGLSDSGEPFYIETLNITNHDSGISFVLHDADKDGVGDGDEVNCGTDPNHKDHYCVSLQGTVTNLFGLSGATYASAVLMNQTIPPWPYEIELGNLEKTVLEQVSITNGDFLIDHLIIDQRGSNEVWNLWLEVYQDMTSNGVFDVFEPITYVRVAVTNHTMEYEVQLDVNPYDADGDLIPDGWEYANGLSFTNNIDAFADPDGDWIDNLWEYRLHLDPYTYNTNNYAFADAMQAVDSRIEGLNPSNAIHIFSEDYWVTTNLTRNPNCWAGDIDLTCCSPWNSYNANKRAGTLISPRHAIFVNHLPPPNTFFIPEGYDLRFVDATNGGYTATIESIHHLDYTAGADLTVAVLTEDVPTNRFSFAKILPEYYTNYLGHAVIHVPGLCLDQEEKALVHDLKYPSRYTMPIYGDRINYSDEPDGLISGDSGNPGFIILNNELVITTLWRTGGGGGGTSVTSVKEEINAIMNTNGNYSLTEIDLSGYIEIPENLR